MYKYVYNTHVYLTESSVNVKDIGIDICTYLNMQVGMYEYICNTHVNKCISTREQCQGQRPLRWIYVCTYICR